MLKPLDCQSLTLESCTYRLANLDPSMHDLCYALLYHAEIMLRVLILRFMFFSILRTLALNAVLGVYLVWSSQPFTVRQRAQSANTCSISCATIPSTIGVEPLSLPNSIASPSRTHPFGPLPTQIGSRIYTFLILETS